MNGTALTLKQELESEYPHLVLVEPADQDKPVEIIKLCNCVWA